ncbi:pyridoxal phosphate-dependent aminotransferase [Myxococcota bacterium]|nr:pyridoxal phosphate-dependent aminotransferase [Myxococcota bacterium]
MFSERTAWPRDENPLARAIEAAKQRAGTSLVDLTVSNPTNVGLRYDRPAILSALAHEEALVYKPSPFGLPSAREAVARYYAARGITVSADDVLIAATTSEAYSFLFHLLANVGESVAIPSPSYPLFSYLADLADVDLEPYHLRYGADEGWRLDTSSLDEVTSDVTRAIITVSPNNPTGSHASAEERAWLVDFARERGLAIISDEVFLDYLRDPAATKLASFAGEPGALCFTLSGVSKVAGLPQMKLSWIVASGPRALVDEAKARLEIVADTFLSVATPIQRALPEILEGAATFQADLRARLAENEATLASLTRGTDVVPRRSAGGWYAIVDLPGTKDDEGWALALVEDEGVLAHPGYLFDVEEPSALVLSLIVPPADFAEGIRRVVRRAAR